MDSMWFHRSGVVLVLVIAAAVIQPRGIDSNEESQVHVLAEPLIAQLGDDSYQRREEASRALEALGEKILPVLRAAAKAATDPEIRLRCQLAERGVIRASGASPTLGLESVLIEPGSFAMGSHEGEEARRGDELQHGVRISQIYLLGRFEVTQRQYARVMKSEPSWFAATGGGREKVAEYDTAEFPVERVTWFDAVEFCNRLSKLDGYEPYYEIESPVREEGAIVSATVTIRGGNGYRLPTEAEWEYACRAGSRSRFSFGESSDGSQANVKSTVAVGGYGGGGSRVVQLGRTAQAGSYEPNRWGLCDMHGNVGEWCWDWYDRDYYAESPEVDPHGPESGRHRVLRGGSWLVSDGSCRSASRLGLGPGEQKDFAGFRVARTP